jgi:hypothetical protein
MILFCAMTVVLGLNTRGGLALLLQPNMAAEFLGLSSKFALGLGAACLLLSMLYVGLAAVLRRPIGIKQWKILMPPLRLALAQVVVGTINYVFVAAALHQMLLSVTDIGYVAVATIYVVGNVATLVSHVPGGLGVLEAVVIYLVPQPAVIGALVAFRVIYFLIPFGMGALLFAAYELAQRRSGANHGARAAG